MKTEPSQPAAALPANGSATASADVSPAPLCPHGMSGEVMQNLATSKIRYEAGYKYQLHEDAWIQAEIKGLLIIHEYFRLTPDGVLQIMKGYAWDGASGWTLDTASTMRGALVHDVLYQAMRLGLLPQSYFAAANRELQRICQLDGMNAVRAWIWYQAVQYKGSVYAAITPEKILTAP